MSSPSWAAGGIGTWSTSIDSASYVAPGPRPGASHGASLSSLRVSAVRTWPIRDR